MLTAPIDTNSSGDTTLVDADTQGRRIRVLGYKLVAAGSVVVQFFDGPSSDSQELTGPMSQITGVPNDGNPAPHGDMLRQYHFQTSPSSALVLNLGSDVQVSGYVSYIFAL